MTHSTPLAPNASPLEPTPLDASLLDEAGRDHIEQVARLYLIVQGRPPDRGGLEAYTAVLRAGKTLADLAADFLASDEFGARNGAEDPVTLLCNQALGPGQPPPPHHSLPGLVCSLVLSPIVAERLPILPALFPDGARLDHPADYRTWLAFRRCTHPNTSPAAPAVSISVILPIEDPNAQWPEATIRSVLAQTGLELLIAAPRLDGQARLLAMEYPCVRLVRQRLWPTASRLFARALARATGLFTILLHPGDHLAPSTAAAIATVAARADIILSDEDALDAEGRRHAPRFGDAWDPDRMLAAGRPGSLIARTELLRKAGGMRLPLLRPPVLRSRQPRPDWDLLLRASVHTTPARIIQIPEILLSRARPAPVATQADEQAVRAYLRATGQLRTPSAATTATAIATAEHGRLRVVYPLPKQPPRASIVIATRDRAELLDRCTEGLLHRTDYPDTEIVVVDNGTTDPAAITLLNRLGLHPRIRIIPGAGLFNWATLNNLGVRHATGEVVVLLNNDTDVIAHGWLRELVSHAIRPGVGIVGAKLLYPDNTIQHAGMVLARSGNALHMWRHSPGDAPGYLDSLVVTREVTAVTGACLAVKRDTYEAIGGCNETLPLTWNDVDLCLRIRERGLRVIWTPHACLMHLEQATRGRDDDPVNQARYKREQAWMRNKWGDAFVTDPFLNRNLLPSERRPILAPDV